MKHCLLLLLLITAHLASTAQHKEGQERLDSLLSALASSQKADTAQAALLAAISYDLSRINAKKGISYGQQGLQLAESLKWKSGTARCCIELGCNYEAESDYVQALKYELRALKIYEELNDHEGIKSAYGCIASVYYGMEDYPKALTYDSLAMNMAIAMNNIKAQGLYLANLASTHAKMSAFAKGITCDSLAIEIAKQIGDKGSEASAYQNLATLYENMGNDAEALKYYFKALAIYESIGDKGGRILALGGIGSAYVIIATDTTHKTKPTDLVSASKAENVKKGIKYLSLAADGAREIGDMTSVWMASMFLADAYAYAGDGVKALELYKQYTQYKDSLVNNDNRLKIAAMETEREAELKNKQIELVKLEQVKKKNERLLFSAGSLLLVAVIIAVYRNFKAQRKTNEIQKEALVQKEMLMKEIHHRVKNNLQVISTLLDLQLVNITDEQAKDAITESNTRLRAISLIHQQLYQDDHITTIEFSRFSEDLHKQLSGIFSKPGQRVTFTNNIPAGTLDIDTAVPLGMILNELMTNSYKYAFGKGNGNITISTEQRKDHYALIYHDSGPGIADGFDIKTSKSLGMRIIYRLSRQVGGTCTYLKDKNEFMITYRDIAGRKMID